MRRGPIHYGAELVPWQVKAALVLIAADELAEAMGNLGKLAANAGVACQELAESISLAQAGERLGEAPWGEA